MSDEPPTRRRIDRVTDEDFLEGLSQRSASELRQMRDDCREEEARLSYSRRLLHGQLDIARAELKRRGSGDTGSLVAHLGEILAEEPPEREARSAGNAEIYDPSEEEGHRPGDRVLDGVVLADLPDLDDEALVAAVNRLTEEEHTISGLRRKVLDHLDQLQRELIDRYREGDTSVDEVVPRPAS